MKYNFQKQARPQQAQNPAAQAAEARKKYEREIQAVARKVDQYRIDGQRFFAGDLKLPPDELGSQIRADLRRLQGSKLATSADSFRLGSLEARYNSQSELFGRRLRQREEGTANRPTAHRPELDHDPREGVVMSREGAVEALYKGLYLEGGRGKPTMDLDRFRNQIQKQAEAIRVKTGASDIQFRIAEENGKMKIKAKPIKKKAGA